MDKKTNELVILGEGARMLKDDFSRSLEFHFRDIITEICAESQDRLGFDEKSYQEKMQVVLTSAQIHGVPKVKIQKMGQEVKKDYILRFGKSA